MKNNNSSLSERIRYFFDNTLAKGPIGLLIWLGLFISILIIFISILVWATGINEGTAAEDSLIEQTWVYLMTTFAVIDADIGGNWVFRLASLIIILSGIFVMRTLIGILTTAIDSKLEKLRKGR